MNPSIPMSIKKISKERLITLDLLLSSLLKQKKIDTALEKIAKDNDLRLNQVYNLVYGVARRHVQLNAYINTKFKSAAPNLSVQLVLEIALFELIYNTAAKDYAVVNEALNVLDAKGLSWFKGLTNAILRNFLRNKDQEILEISKYPIFPAWLTKEIESVFKNKSEQIINTLLSQRPLYICINTKKVSEVDFISIMKDKKFDLIKTDAGSFICNDFSILKTDEFSNGFFFVQDLASQIAISKLFSDVVCDNPKILDACSAPGGKAIKSAIILSDNAEIIAMDKSQNRLKSVKENLERLGLSSIKLCCKDFLDFEEGNEEFDYIIIDPPCSALGVIARHPDIIWNKGYESIEELSKLQKALLFKGFEKLKKGGKLLYSVCTFTHKETIGVINNIDFELLESFLTIPSDQNMDGHFIAIFRKG